jgi:hypothetical protein
LITGRGEKLGGLFHGINYAYFTFFKCKRGPHPAGMTDAFNLAGHEASSGRMEGSNQ